LAPVDGLGGDVVDGLEPEAVELALASAIATAMMSLDMMPPCGFYF
jgi:ABC-type proline/glycine betaine transport system permease subunit